MTTKYPYQNPKLSIEERVKDLIGRMNTDEKIQQLWHIHSVALLANTSVNENDWDYTKLDAALQGNGIGLIQHPQRSQFVNAKLANDIQRYMMKNTRWGIPVILITETLHGHLSSGSTVFPQAITLSSAFDEKLVEEVGSAIGLEAGSAGVHETCAPVLDLAQDPRWGRVEEGYGEDPYLTSRLGTAYVNGVQGRNYDINREHIGCTVKHYLAYSISQGGLNCAPSSLGERALREWHLPPFKYTLQKAKPLAVMPSYGEVDGIPVHQNEFLLTTLLRDEIGFDGLVVSDYGGVEFLKTLHQTAENFAEAGKLALKAGCDVDAPNRTFNDKEFKENVKSGKIPMQYIDRALTRVLRCKFRLGLFENPFVDEEKCKKVVHQDKHVALALKAAQDSIVLLKNENNLLPLSKKTKLAVIGPNADVAQLGGYCIGNDGVVSPLQGIKNKADGQAEISYAKGCEIVGTDTSRIAEAVETAKKADVAVLIVGGASMIRSGIGWGKPEKEGAPCTCGEGFDRSELDLPGVQEQLVEAVAAVGKPTVVIMQNGRPQSISWIAKNIPAIIEAWYPGEQGGNAIADILYGNVSPCGRLTMSFPQAVGQIPMFYNYKPSARGRVYRQPGSVEKPGRNYVFMSPDALWEFGHGLSYTTFTYSDLQVTPAIALDGQAKVSVKIKNTGHMKAKEAVLCFVRDEVSSVTTPIRALKGFHKIELAPGEEQEVTFTLGFEELSLFNAKMEQVVEKGTFTVMIGELSATFEVK